MAHLACSLLPQHSLDPEDEYINLCPSETSVNFYRNARRHIPEDGIIHSYLELNKNMFAIIKPKNFPEFMARLMWVAIFNGGTDGTHWGSYRGECRQYWITL
jgi:hypothetical protein